MSFLEDLKAVSPVLVPSKMMGAIALGVALAGIAAASILLVIAEQEISPYAATFNRLSLATLIFLAWLGQQQLTRLPATALNGSSRLPLNSLFLFSELKLSDLGLLFLAGTAFSASLSLWAWSLSQTSVANSTLLNNMMPIFTTVGAWIFLHQTFSRQFLWGMGVAIAGAVIIGLEDLQVTQGLLGDEAALGAAMLSAVYILSVERLRQRFETPWIMMWTSLIGSGCLAIVLVIGQDQFFPSSSTGWLAVIALAIISQVLGQGLLTYCLKEFSAGFVSVSMLTIPVIAAVAARVLFGEALTLLNWAAFGIVLTGIYLAISAQNPAAGVSRVTILEDNRPEVLE